MNVALSFLIGVGIGWACSEFLHWLREVIEIAREEGEW